MHIDVFSSVIYNIGFSFFMSLSLFWLAKGSLGEIKGVKKWATALSVQGFGWLLLTFVKIVPEAVLPFFTCVSTSISILALALYFHALVEFKEAQISVKPAYLVVLVAFILQIYFGAILKNEANRMIVVALFVALLCFKCGWFLLSNKFNENLLSNKLTAYIFVFCGVVLTARGVYYFFNPSNAGVFNSNCIQDITYVTFFVSIIFGSFGFLLMCVDKYIDMKIQAENSLQLQENRFLSTQHDLKSILFSATEFSIIATDKNGLITVFNRGAELMLGYCAEEMIGKYTPAIIHSESEIQQRALELSEELQKPISGFQVFTEKPNQLGQETREWLYIRKDKTAFTLLLTVTAIKNEQGEITGYLGIGSDLTERKHIENELRQSENRFRSIIELAPIPFALNDDYQNILFLNRNFTETFGYDLNDIPKLDIWWNKAYPDETYRKWVIDTWGQALDTAKKENKAFVPFEIAVTCKDGSQKTVLAAASMFEDLVDYHLVMLYDITERKKSELLLQESEKRFRTVADAAPVLIWLGNNTDKFSCTWVNKRLLDFTGRTLEQECGDGWMEIIHPDDLQHCLDVYVSSFDNREPFSMEYRLKNHQGEYKWVLDNGTPISNSFGEFEGYIGSCVDITERVNSFEKLKNSEQKLQLLTSIIESSQDAFYVLDVADNYRMIFVNKAACKHYGLPKEKLLTMRVPDWDPDVDFDKLAEFLPILRKDNHVLLKSRHHAAEGTIPVEISISYLKDESGEYAFGYITDLRPRLQLEATLLEAKERAELLAKSKSEFLANMSHEIRTPMTAIIGLSQLALNKEMPNDVRDSLTKVHQSAESLLGILNDILDFSKLEAGKLTLQYANFNLVAMFRHLHNLFSVAAKNKQLEFSILADDGIPNELIGDSLRIQQIISNLLGNAIKFTATGKVEFSVKLIEYRENAIVLRFSVQDTGIGVKKENQENLFKAFNQADNSITRRFGGTGLGLTISRDLLLLMDSDFHIDSVEGQGTTIYFDLLLALPNTEKRHVEPENSDEVNQEGSLQERLCEFSKSLVGTKILFAEDNPLNQEIVSSFLKMSGIEIDIADNGLIALALLESNSYDAILMDVHMPEMDGLQATKIIREQAKYANLPIIALTAGITTEEQEKCLSVGMTHFVEKPINPEILLKTLSRCVKVSKFLAQRNE